MSTASQVAEKLAKERLRKVANAPRPSLAEVQACGCRLVVRAGETCFYSCECGAVYAADLQIPSA